MVDDLAALLQQSAARHSHLCPRQVLGVRMGLAGLAALGLPAPITRAAGLIIIESDGCFADGIEVATGARLGHRTLHVRDFGKAAATFADLVSGRALRLSPRPDVRTRASAYAPGLKTRYYTQLNGYQAMPVDELFFIQPVALQPPLAELLSRSNVRVTCSRCGEEIINGRQLHGDGGVLCRSCAGGGYYRVQA